VAGPWRKPIICAGALGCAILLAGCTRQGKYQPLGMWNNSRLKPYEGSLMDAMPTASRAPVAGSVARGELYREDPINTGRSGARLLAASPLPVTPAVLARGQERYNVYCSPCHSRLGDGEGMAVKRSFPHPPDFAIQRLRTAPVGHFFDVMTNGYGVMYSYAERVPPADRWAIASYIRVLQKTRPVVTEDRYEAERIRAREAGIRDPKRGMRIPDTQHSPGSDQQPGHDEPPPANRQPAGGHGPNGEQQPEQPPHTVPPTGNPARGGTEVQDPITGRHR